MLILAMSSQTFHSYFPLFDADHLKIANCSNLTIVFYPLGNFGQALCTRPCHKDLIKSHTCSGIAFIQGESAGGSKLIEQTLPVKISENRILSIYPTLCRVKVLCYQYYSSPLKSVSNFISTA